MPSGEKDLFEGSSEPDQQQQPQQKQDSQPQQAPPNLVLDFSEIIAGVQKLGTQISENPEVINLLMKSKQVVTESVQPMVESLAQVINDPGCTVCGTKLGSLYKCQTCLNYNLCESCYYRMNQQQYSADTGYTSILHDSSHVFTRILRPADEADNKKAVIEGKVEQVIAMGDAAAVAGASRERIRELVVYFGGDLDRVVQALNDECLD
ncbi:hypothetical protein BDR26DRAFT_896073 [Obelidium mucronatum]|nr:hypothetical protein BDR26DRAFT_896073 [Obelidium mucronatum]